MAKIKPHPHAFSPDCCPVSERTADMKPVGRCWHPLKGKVCPRHGDVSKAVERLLSEGKLTDEYPEYWPDRRKGVPNG